MVSISHIPYSYERATRQLRDVRLVMNLIAEHVLLLFTLSTGVGFTALGLVVGFDLGLYNALICALIFYFAGTILTFKTMKRADGFIFQLRLQDIPKESWDSNQVAEVMSGMILRSYKSKGGDDTNNTTSNKNIKCNANHLWKKAGRSVQEECCICFEEYGGIDTLHFAPRCGHAFHGNCIKQWIGVSMANKTHGLSETQQKKVFPTCPLCNESLIRNTKVG